MRNEELKDLLELHTKAIKAEVKATTDLLSYKIDGIIERQDIANHRTTKLEEKVIPLESHVEYVRNLKKYYKYAIPVFLLLMVGASLLSHWLIENDKLADFFQYILP